MCKLLVEHGASVHAMAFGPFFQKTGACFFGMLPLSFAVSLGNLEIMKYLVEAGADVNGFGESLNTALHMAVFHHQIEAYDLLLSMGADNQDCFHVSGRIPAVLDKFVTIELVKL
eukprot:7585349-Pyramimonas_sp.AAC.1